MAKQLVWYNVHVRGFGEDFDQANARALERLREAAEELRNGRTPQNPGIGYSSDDPGGGGGPCAPEYISIEVNVTPSGLPEAETDDEDDD